MEYKDYKDVEIISYKEGHDVTDKYKGQYLDGFEKIIKRREIELAEKRDTYCKDIFENQEQFRDDLKNMLGWPLTEEKCNNIPNVITEKLSEENGFTIYRMQFEILDNVYMTGLYFKTATEKRPLVIAQHGGVGSPERVAGFYGSTANYNDMIDRILQFDCNVFAPQVLVWDSGTYNEYNVSYDRRAVDGRLKRVGSSVAAVEVYGITRIIDYFDEQDYIGNIGMIGLSYGGFYTLFTTAIDTRIKAAISCSFFNKRDEYAWADWTWNSSAEKFSDAEIACLIYPRKFCIEVGDKDETFNVSGALSEIKRLEDLCKDKKEEWLKFIVFDGRHEFCRDDEPIKNLIDELI